MAHEILDVKELNCSLPILRAKQAPKAVAVGATLEVLATAPGRYWFVPGLRSVLPRHGQ